MSIDEEKSELRRGAALAIAALSRDERSRADRVIVAALLGLDAYRDSEQVLAYQPLADEVDVLEFAETAEREGRAVLFPIVSEDGELRYRRWRRGEALVRSALGVLEPREGDGPREVPSVVLVPGRVFSADGWRVGRGGGYYDRALPSLARYGATVGVAYSCQIMPSVAHASHDQRVDLVVSEHGANEAASRGLRRATIARSGE